MALNLKHKAKVWSGLSESDLSYLVFTAPERYKVYRIRKKTRGFRIIAQPARELKDLQRFLMTELLQKLPVHNSATAYLKGCSIRGNAAPHLNSKVLLKLDFTNFFGSITPKDFDSVIDKQNLPLSNEDFEFCHQTLFWKNKWSSKIQLSIGAPSSPMLSNAVMFEFDNNIATYCKNSEVIFTRYADDITLSANDTQILLKVKKKIEEQLRKFTSPKLKLNTSKTVIVTKKNRRIITGLVLSNQGKVSVGREKKRTLRAKLHRFSRDELCDDDVESLRGDMAFINSVEPDFILRMKKKYGEEIIKALFRRKFLYKYDGSAS